MKRQNKDHDLSQMRREMLGGRGKERKGEWVRGIIRKLPISTVLWFL